VTGKGFVSDDSRDIARFFSSETERQGYLGYFLNKNFRNCYEQVTNCSSGVTLNQLVLRAQGGAVG
jgi:hypothetical protein